jgi:hypothetical protein
MHRAARPRLEEIPDEAGDPSMVVPVRLADLEEPVRGDLAALVIDLADHREDHPGPPDPRTATEPEVGAHAPRVRGHAQEPLDPLERALHVENVGSLNSGCPRHVVPPSDLALPAMSREHALLEDLRSSLNGVPRHGTGL